MYDFPPPHTPALANQLVIGWGRKHWNKGREEDQINIPGRIREQIITLDLRQLKEESNLHQLLVEDKKMVARLVQ